MNLQVNVLFLGSGVLPATTRLGVKKGSTLCATLERVALPQSPNNQYNHTTLGRSLHISLCSVSFTQSSQEKIVPMDTIYPSLANVHTYSFCI